MNFAARISLTAFMMVRDRLFGTGKRYLTFGPSKKSMKRIREKIHGITHADGKMETCPLAPLETIEIH